ncbi:serine hydrolase [Pseudomonas chlororaphis]|uniref:serine hydrolase n=1 Tax=Pseudomonas chlororaphis TaxID=587753 RepID=UPI0021F4C01E|nr:serine hydrolase [Pseudomonas chlororaphis]
MNDTGFSVKDPARLGAAYRDDRPRPSRMQDETTIKVGESTTLFSLQRIFDPRAYPSGGAGMAGTASDVARFLDTLRQGGGPVLSAPSVQAMMIDQVGAQAQTQGQAGASVTAGRCWTIRPWPAPRNPGHLAMGRRLRSQLVCRPQARLTLVALTNTAFEGMSGAFTREIRDAAYPAP